MTQLKRSGNYAAMAQIARSLAHDIGSHLTALKGHVYLTEQKLKAFPEAAAAVEENLKSVAAASDNLEQLGRKTFAFIALPDGAPQKLELGEVFETVASPLALPKNIKSGAMGSVMFNLEALCRLLSELMENAEKLTAGAGDTKGAPCCTLTFSKKGAEDFTAFNKSNPFLSTKTASVGLSLSRVVLEEIAAAYGASLTFKIKGKAAKAEASFTLCIPTV